MASPYTALPQQGGPSRTPSSSSSRSPRSSSSSANDDDLTALELDPHPRRARRDTLSTFAFPSGGFGEQLGLVGGVPLTLSAEDPTGAGHRIGKDHGRPRLGVINGVALVVGLQIGSGIFSSPGLLLSATGSPGAALLVWLAAGALAWSGASSFVELGCAVPVNGGAAAYLNYAYGPLTAYLFSWTAVTLLKPGSAAIISLIFGEYVMRLVYAPTTAVKTAADGAAPASEAAAAATEEAPEWTFKLLVILVVTAINLFNARAGAHVQVGLTGIKMLSLVFILVLAAIYASSSGLGHLSSSGGEGGEGGGLWADSTTEVGRYAIALYSGLWAFDGWDQSNYVAGEMRNVARDLPRVVHLSMAAVVALFASVNLAYFVVLPREVVGASNTVALDFGAATLGTPGAFVFSILVATSCFGALNGSTITSATLVVQAGREGWLPNVFGELWSGGRAGWAMLLQAALTVAYILFGGGFRSLINFFSVANWLFYFLTVLGLLILRVKEPHLERPYQTFLATPIVFCAVALFLLIMPVVAAPAEALAAFAFIGLGVPLYYITDAVAASSSDEKWWAILWRRIRSSSSSEGRMRGGRGEESEGMMMAELDR